MSKRFRPNPGFYKSILTDDFGVHFNEKYKPETKAVVMGIYEVERIVARRPRGRKHKFFVKWKGYSSAENTWEPEEHLSNELIDSFINSHVDEVRVEECRERLASLLENNLKSKAMECNESLIMRHDVVRHLFPRIPLNLQGRPFDVSEQELIQADLGTFLRKRFTIFGGSCGVKMPLQLKLFLSKSPVSRDVITGQEIAPRVMEKIKISFLKEYHAAN